MAGVVFQNVAKVYPDGTRAVDELALDIRDGEFVVIVGPSGSGKSTALRVTKSARGQSFEVDLWTRAEVSRASRRPRRLDRRSFLKCPDDKQGPAAMAAARAQKAN